MDFNTGLSYAGIGIGVVVSLLAMKPMHPGIRGALFGIGGLFLAAGLWGIFTGSRSEPDGGKPSVSIQQENPYQSPAIIGDKNTVTITPKVKPWRIVKREEFVQALRAAGPSTLDLNCEADRDAEDLFEDLNKMLIDGRWVIRNRARVDGMSRRGVVFS